MSRALRIDHVMRVLLACTQSGRDAGALAILTCTPSSALINQTLAHALDMNVSLADLQCVLCPIALFVL